MAGVRISQKDMALAAVSAGGTLEFDRTSDGTWLSTFTGNLLLRGIGAGGQGGGGARPNNATPTIAGGAGAGGGAAEEGWAVIPVVKGVLYNIDIGAPGSSQGAGATTNNTEGTGGFDGAETRFLDADNVTVLARFAGASGGAGGKLDAASDECAYGGTSVGNIAKPTVTPGIQAQAFYAALWNQPGYGGRGGPGGTTGQAAGDPGNPSRSLQAQSAAGAAGADSGGGCGGSGGGGGGTSPFGVGGAGGAGGAGSAATGAAGAAGSSPASTAYGAGGGGGGAGGNGAGGSANGGNGAPGIGGRLLGYRLG